ncbi:MAG: hypothetical protein M3Q79_01050 [bacterium]|nr:hypothetical protein [bacterium]
MFKLDKIMARTSRVFVVLALVSAQLVPGMFLAPQIANAAPVCINDQQGANDEPGQKDLTRLCKDTAGLPTSQVVSWNFDDTGWSGANTGDACSLFDSDGDGFINYSVCVTVQNTPATQIADSPRIYSCPGDDAVDKCFGAVLVPDGGTMCSTSITATQPFGTGSSTPNDTVANCTIVMTSVGGASSKLIDVCSYPSQQPNSDPSDCIISVGGGKIEIVKSLSPVGDGLFNLSIDSVVYASAVGDGGTTTERGVTNGVHTFRETAATGTSLSNYNISVVCRSQNGLGTTLAVTTISTGQFSVNVAEDSDVVCVITNTRTQGGLTVNKVVINDNGGTNTADDFGFKVNNGVAVPFEADGSNSLTINGGTAYTVTEPAASGYTTSYSAGCTGTIVSGQTQTCTITNNDQPGTLIVNKVLTTDNGSTKSVTDFSYQINNASAIPFESDASNSHTVNAGTYSVVEVADTGFTTTYDNCTDVVVPSGGSATCTITNNDKPATVIVNKIVINDNGGTLAANDFSFILNGDIATTFEIDGSNSMSVNAGSYTITETPPSGYSVTYDNCSQVMIANGGTATCTVTNNDIAPLLSVIKNVENDDGGTLTSLDFILNVDGSAVTSGQQNPYNAGIYTISEIQQPGYSFSGISGDCTIEGDVITVALALGGTYTCTLNNSDIAPGLRVTKRVINDDGGTVMSSEFSLYVNGNLIEFGAGGGDVSDNSSFGIYADATAGVSYAISEDTKPGYDHESTVCVDMNTEQILSLPVTLSLDQDVNCTVTNNDQAGTLTINKVVVNDNGGNSLPSAFKFTGAEVNGGVETSFEADGSNSYSVNAGTYNISETSIPTGYTMTGNTCVDVVVGNGLTASCTITNNDNQPSLSLTKNYNDAGMGSGLTANSWYLKADGVETDVEGNGSASSTTGFKAGVYILSETGPTNGIVSDPWICNMGLAQDGITLIVNLGDSVSCSITNYPVQPKLTLVKVIDGSQYGDDATVNDFGLTIGGSVYNSGEAQGLSVGGFAINEGGPTGNDIPSGYEFVSITGEDCPDELGGIVTLELGDDITCTIHNRAIPPTITVVKDVVNNNSGTKTGNDFGIAINGNPAVLTEDESYGDETEYRSEAVVVQANFDNIVSENDTADYVEGNWYCSYSGQSYGVPSTDGLSVTVRLNLGETAVCYIENNDTAHPQIHIEKYGPAIAHEGDTILFTADITNTGDAPLSLNGIFDDVAGNVSSVDGEDGFNVGDTDKDNLLDIGETWKAEVEYTVPTGQVADVVNTMEVCADDATEWMEWSDLLRIRSLDYVEEVLTELDGDTCDTDTHTTDIIHPGLKVDKSGPTSAQAGQTVTYSFTVTNTGDTPIKVTKVEDSIAGAGTYSSGDTDSDNMLDLTETWLYTASYTIPVGQIMPVNNTVTVCGEDQLKEEVCVNDKHTLSIPQVLAAVTSSPVVLADTGARNLTVQLIAGLGIITMALALAVRRKQEN